MKLLQAVLIIISVYLAVRLLLKYYGKSIIRWAGKKAMERVQKQFYQQQSGREETVAKDGRTEVRRPKPSPGPQKKNPNKVVGDYVDYEEID